MVRIGLYGKDVNAVTAYQKEAIRSLPIVYSAARSNKPVDLNVAISYHVLSIVFLLSFFSLYSLVLTSDTYKGHVLPVRFHFRPVSLRRDHRSDEGRRFLRSAPSSRRCALTGVIR